jgi:hypothetical protein
VIRSFTGYCPTQGKDYTVMVNYVETTATDDRIHTYTKSQAECEFNCFGDKCSIKCPISAAAPKDL